MFAVTVQFGIMLLIGVVVSAELYALLQAIGYARKQTGKTLAQKACLALARYEWASVLWHETFCASVGKAPAYRVSYSLGIWAVMMTAFAAAYFGFAVSVRPDVMMGTSLGAAGGFFFGAYGRAFFASREEVQRQIEAGTWVLA